MPSVKTCVSRRSKDYNKNCFKKEGGFLAYLDVIHTAPIEFHAPVFNLTAGDGQDFELPTEFAAKSDSLMEDYELPPAYDEDEDAFVIQIESSDGISSPFVDYDEKGHKLVFASITQALEEDQAFSVVMRDKNPLY